MRAAIRKYVHDLALASLFLALGIVLPFLTGQVPQIGNMLLPMHIPVLLCGLICGWQYGALGIAMAFELCAYGLLVGVFYGRSKWKCTVSLYRSLLLAMVGGRVVWAAARVVLMGVSHVPFGWEAFLSGAFLTAIPGIILQLVLIPAVMVALGRAKLVPFGKDSRETTAG